MELSASEARLIEAATVRARAHQQKTAQERSEPHPDDDVTVRTGLYVVLEKSAGGASAAALVDLFAEYFGVQMLAGTFAGAAEIASVYSAGKSPTTSAGVRAVADVGRRPRRPRSRPEGDDRRARGLAESVRARGRV